MWAGMTKSGPTTGGIGCSSISEITSAVPVKAPRNLSTSASRLAILFAEVAARSNACETISEASFSGSGGRGSFTIFSGVGGGSGGPERGDGGELGGPPLGGEPGGPEGRFSAGGGPDGIVPTGSGKGALFGGESGGPVICPGGPDGGGEPGGASEGGPDSGPTGPLLGGESGGPEGGPPVEGGVSGCDGNGGGPEDGASGGPDGGPLVGGGPGGPSSDGGGIGLPMVLAALSIAAIASSSGSTEEVSSMLSSSTGVS